MRFAPTSLFWFRSVKMADLQENIFPIFKTPPKSPGICRTPSSHGSGPGSPGRSPFKKKTSLTIRQGHNQNNKILRYLQPKRLLEEMASTSMLLPDAKDFPSSANEEKENEALELRVVLSRIDEDAEYPIGVHGNTKKALCCIQERIFESELVVRALDLSIQTYFDNPCHRLGIPRPPCLEAAGCQHETNAHMFSSTQENLLCTMMNSNLNAMMIRECLKRISSVKYPSHSMVHNLFQVMKMAADWQTLFLCERLLKRLLYLHPPCPNMRDFYLSVLHEPNLEIKTSNDYWNVMNCENFENLLQEIEKCVENGLSPAQLKEKLKTPTVRKILKPRRYLQSPSPVKRRRRGRKNDDTNSYPTELDYEDREKQAAEEINDIREQARLKRSNLEAQLQAMSLEMKIDHIFSRFKILVDILEHDLVMWLSRHPNPSSVIRDRKVCPLIVMALWKPAADTGFDTPGCRRIFSLYASSWILKIHPKHLKTLSRLIGLIAEVTSASDPSYKRMYPNMGDRCINMAHKMSDVLRSRQLEGHYHEAILMLRPVWLQMLVSATMLGIPPSISSADPSVLFSKDEEGTSSLWSIFLLSAVATYHVKEADKLLQQAIKSDSCSETPVSCETDLNIDYKTLLNEIVSFYHLRKEFDKESPVLQSLNCYFSFKEILS